jgi:hypothetical protein
MADSPKLTHYEYVQQGQGYEEIAIVREFKESLEDPNVKNPDEAKALVSEGYAEDELISVVKTIGSHITVLSVKKVDDDYMQTEFPSLNKMQK